MSLTYNKNSWTIIGRLTKMPAVTTFSNGVQGIYIGLACQKGFTSETVFVNNLNLTGVKRGDGPVDNSDVENFLKNVVVGAELLIEGIFDGYYKDKDKKEYIEVRRVEGWRILSKPNRENPPEEQGNASDPLENNSGINLSIDPLEN